MMDSRTLIDRTASFVKESLANAEGGHDWWHTYRVWSAAKELSKREKVDMLVVELGALLHDIADSKFHDGDEQVGPRVAEDFLRREGVDEQIVAHVSAIISNISFKVSKEGQRFSSKELEVVQDADRLDALGAIGIARTFSYGGYKGRELFNPSIAPNPDMSKEEYKKGSSPSINHFYEKLLLLKDLMNTQAGREMANERHAFMEKYLEQFYAEWNGER